MTTQDAIDRFADWLREQTAGLEFLLACDDANLNKVDTERELVRPVVYAGNFPRQVATHEGDDRLAQQVAPAVIVAPEKEAELSTQLGVVTLPLVLHLLVWSPGAIDEDGMMHPTNESCRDIVAFTDAIVKALATADFPGGLNLTGYIRYDIEDLFRAPHHPHYMATVSFAVSFVRALPSPYFN